MHDGMEYGPILGQGHEPFKVGNLAVFKSYLLRQLQRERTTNHRLLNYCTISKLDQARYLIFVLVFLCHVTLNLAQMSVAKSRPSVPYGVNSNTSMFMHPPEDAGVKDCDSRAKKL